MREDLKTMKARKRCVSAAVGTRGSSIPAHETERDETSIENRDGIQLVTFTMRTGRRKRDKEA